jgi:prevent-host-death family protein
MKIVGIKELKGHLSAYIMKARQGERVIITDRGKEVAELGPLSGERQALKALAEAGRLRWAGGKPAGVRGIKARHKTVAEAVIEDRR